MCFNREGELTAIHRKLHMFDIDMKGKVTAKESEHVKPGEPKITIFDTEYCKVNIYQIDDIRRLELGYAMI